VFSINKEIYEVLAESMKFYNKYKFYDIEWIEKLNLFLIDNRDKTELV